MGAASGQLRFSDRAVSVGWVRRRDSARAQAVDVPAWGDLRAATDSESLTFHEPNEIAAGIVEVGKLRRPHGLGLVSKHNALGPQALELGGDVLGVELRQR